MPACLPPVWADACLHLRGTRFPCTLPGHRAVPHLCADSCTAAHPAVLQLHEVAQRHGITEISTDVYSFLARAVATHLGTFLRQCTLMARQRRDAAKRC